ncbi:MAG: CYTH domain-containing protein [Candidatus Saccharibacteria bacterium]|nr:CYTH domain-containing protein [Candidatus Saccharibacteria bacterium]
MSKEIEARILNIDPEKIITKLVNIGAKKIGDYDFKRYVFDTIPKNSNRWVRLRTNGQNTTLTVKEIESGRLDGTNEWEVEVSDFDETLIILEKIGIKPRGYQENTRIEFQLEDTHFMIDHWPLIGHILEIESNNSSNIYKYSKLLDFKESDLTTKNINSIFLEKGIDLQKTQELKF